MLVTGRATLNGQFAPAGAPVEAYVDGRPCGAATTAEGGTYSVQVADEATQSSCSAPGATVTFEVYGVPADQTTTYQSGAVVALDLTGQGEAPARPPEEFCFDAALLPPTFVLQRVRILPNRRAAELDIGAGVQGPERLQRVEERLRVYERQVRRTGLSQVYVDRRLVEAQALDPQGQLEALRALAAEPYVVAQCLVGLYRTAQGAQAGYAETMAALLTMPLDAVEYRRVDARAGDIAVAAVYHRPDGGGTCVFVGVLRVGSTVGAVTTLLPSPTGPRDCTDLAGSGLVLLQSMADRLRVLEPQGGTPPVRPEVTPSPTPSGRAGTLPSGK